ncbi:LOW QUALITY PROTEIN: uncharacterized protein LOC114074861 [Solanum pennellii]|uniref:LOW QUALITY PROTEIN: uncharacterized protein LOC114074861 n=1 Tax=Solanum pennellii TaxID=28526 RepID=A0ABM1UYZ3_SOLPN|nr:LOW QUALITY PROTEIN: uncharacterized protein LOC114074861 [Solanum pennellii]
MCSYCKKHQETKFQTLTMVELKVLDMLEDACDSLLESIVTENKF